MERQTKIRMRSRCRSPNPSANPTYYLTKLLIIRASFATKLPIVESHITALFTYKLNMRLLFDMALPEFKLDVLGCHAMPLATHACAPTVGERQTLSFRVRVWLARLRGNEASNSVGTYSRCAAESCILTH